MKPAEREKMKNDLRAEKAKRIDLAKLLPKKLRQAARANIQPKGQP